MRWSILSKRTCSALTQRPIRPKSARAIKEERDQSVQLTEKANRAEKRSSWTTVTAAGEALLEQKSAAEKRMHRAVSTLLASSIVLRAGVSVS